MLLFRQTKSVCLLLLGVFLCSGLQATEPFIFARILTEWDETGETLNLTILPDRSLVNATLRLEIPETLVLEPAVGPFRDRFHERADREGFRILEAVLGDLPARSALSLSFRPSGHHARGGVVSFILEGETEQGDPVREAIGVVVGHPGVRPDRRHGALEYPAVSLPGERQ